jgi:hypothetical protein
MALALSTQAQVSSQLQLRTIQLDGAASVAFTFVDQGTGSTNYTVELLKKHHHYPITELNTE